MHIVCPPCHIARQRVVATGTIFNEQKFIHEAGLVAHVEDVVVDSACRGINRKNMAWDLKEF
jgi:glucosamine-phosphate N-acetyltransferase